MTQLSFIGLLLLRPQNHRRVTTGVYLKLYINIQKQTNDARLWGNFQRLPISPAAVFQITVQ